MNCCNHNCNQGRSCPNRYKANFDHLGNLIKEPALKWHDYVCMAIFVIALFGTTTGWFQ